MHEMHILQNIFKYLHGKEDSSKRKIKKVNITISEFSGLKEAHLREHLSDLSLGTKWENLAVEIRKVPFGPELEITRIDFESPQGQKREIRKYQKRRCK
jgi:Zn finger protein HypA/HybF involved in hydrogenase expression